MKRTNRCVEAAAAGSSDISTASITFTTNYTYDPITHQRASISNTLDGSTAEKINYVYDPGTGLLTETWTGSNHTTAQNDILYGYDNQGRLESVSQVRLNNANVTGISGGTRYSANGTSISTTYPTILYTYDGDGNVLTVSDPNGMKTTYTYNDMNELIDEVVTNTNSNHTLFSEVTYYYYNGQKHEVIDSRYLANGTLYSQFTNTWTYDGLNRLIEEQVTVTTGAGNSDVPSNYTNQFYYDLDSNRVRETLNGGSGVSGGSTINYTYNADDQLLTEVETSYGNITVYATAYAYDAQGNLAGQMRVGSSGTTIDLYAYNMQNHMVGDTKLLPSGSEIDVTGFVYDNDGVLAFQSQSSENEDGSNQTTLSSVAYLNDPMNPTGNTKAIQTTSSYGGSATLVTSYVLGLKVEAQIDSTNGMLYLLSDGHGSTRALTTSNASISSGQTYDYDAFGTALDFNPATVDTTWLFGGDGFYDSANGWTYQLARWRNGFWFTQSDGGSYAQNDEPLSEQNYMYAWGDPVNGSDSTGHFLFFGDLLASTAIRAGMIAAALTVPISGIIAEVTEVAGAVFLADLAVKSFEDYGILPVDNFSDQLLNWSANVFFAGFGLNQMTTQMGAFTQSGNLEEEEDELISANNLSGKIPQGAKNAMTSGNEAERDALSPQDRALAASYYRQIGALNTNANWRIVQGFQNARAAWLEGNGPWYANAKAWMQANGIQ